ncbi:hypothetical protein CMU89_07715 [Elizabethkingia anophelis]|nr:hypothetical protein [Elizabethkingia anophelis]MDV3542541.1 hypothetical protein [Elizabethkingia anophelis]
METKLITIKKLNNGKYFFDINIHFAIFLILFALIFPLIYIPSRDLLFSLLCTVFFWIFITTLILINNFFGKKVHHKIFEKEVFKNLIQQGFEKEKIDQYEGLITKKNNRTIRIFYNWNKTAEGFLSFGDIEINIFYKPQVIDGDLDKINIDRLKSLNKKYDKTLWSKTNRTIFTYHHLKICFNYYPWTKSQKIEDEINRGLQILQENDIEELDVKNSYTEDFFYPNMQYIWEYQKKNKKQR